MVQLKGKVELAEYMHVEKDYYRITLIPISRDARFKYNWQKEIITKRIASKKLMCHECEETIKKGDQYIRDKFYYENAEKPEWQKKQTNFICMNCWRGEIPKGISQNWKTEDKQNWLAQQEETEID